MDEHGLQFLGHVRSGALRMQALTITNQMDLTSIVDVEAAEHAATDAILAQQRPDGHWVYELEADATIPAEYVLLVHYLAEAPNLELERINDGGQFNAQMSKEEFQQLQPKAGEQVYVELKNVKVFPEDYSI